MNDMAISCGIILVTMVGMLWALCGFDRFDD